MKHISLDIVEGFKLDDLYWGSKNTMYIHNLFNSIKPTNLIQLWLILRLLK
jgi:hypothetical protein